MGCLETWLRSHMPIALTFPEPYSLVRLWPRVAFACRHHRVSPGATHNFGGEPVLPWNIDEAGWQKLVVAKGDWSVLGISVKKNEPVTNFDEYVRRWREARVKVK